MKKNPLLVCALVTVISVVSQVHPACAEEKKEGFMAWSANLMKKNTGDKQKGIPANQSKAKVKGIPTQPKAPNTAFSNELTADERKIVDAATFKAPTMTAPGTRPEINLPASVRVPTVPKIPTVPQPIKLPPAPNYKTIKVPELPKTPNVYVGSLNAPSGAPAAAPSAQNAPKTTSKAKP